MAARWFAFVVWALVAGSAVFWGFKLFVKAPAAPPHTQVVAPGAAMRGDLTRLFGPDAPLAAADAAPEPPASARFQLLGVVAPRSPKAGEGLALIAVDGRTARAYRVGAVVDGDNVLQSVRARGASLGPRGGEAVLALEIPLPAAAATGTLPVAGAAAAVTAPAGRAGMPPRPPSAQAPPPRQPPVFNPLQIAPPPQGQDGEPVTGDVPASAR